jgi:hypothetical protein
MSKLIKREYAKYLHITPIQSPDIYQSKQSVSITCTSVVIGHKTRRGKTLKSWLNYLYINAVLGQNVTFYHHFKHLNIAKEHQLLAFSN